MSKISLPKMIVSIIFTAFLIWRADLKQVINTLSNINTTYVFFIYFTLIPGAMISTYKWKILLRAQGISRPMYLELWGLYYVGMFFSNFLPTEMGGDLYRCYVVGRRSGKLTESFAAVAMERVTGFIAVLIYGVSGVFINWQLAKNMKGVQVLFLTILILIAIFALLSSKTLAIWMKKKLETGILYRFRYKIMHLYEAFYLYREKKWVFLGALGISIVFQLYIIWFTFALLQCAKINKSFFEMLLVVPVITIISMLPITINGIGLREGAFVYTFTHIGITLSESLAIALLFRLGMLLPSLAGGLIFANRRAHGSRYTKISTK